MHRTAPRRKLGLGLAAALVAVFGFFAGRAIADQPYMRAALDQLREAREELQAAARDKGGHRVRALRLVEQAMGEVESGIRFERRQ